MISLLMSLILLLAPVASDAEGRFEPEKLSFSFGAVAPTEDDGANGQLLSESSLLVQPLRCRRLGKSEFYEIIELIEKNIETYFPGDTEFAFVQDELLAFAQERAADHELFAHRYRRGAAASCCICGVVSGFLFHKIIREADPDNREGSGPVGCAIPACAVCAVFAPLMGGGSGLLYVMTHDAPDAKYLLRDDIAKLNTIIENYNTKVKHSCPSRGIRDER